MREATASHAETSGKIGAENSALGQRAAWTGEFSTPMLKECNLHIVELDYSGRRAPAGFPKVYRHCIHPVRGGVARHGISSGQESVIVDRGSDQHTAFAEYVGGVLPTLR